MIQIYLFHEEAANTKHKRTIDRAMYRRSLLTNTTADQPFEEWTRNLHATDVPVVLGFGDAAVDAIKAANTITRRAAMIAVDAPAVTHPVASRFTIQRKAPDTLLRAAVTDLRGPAAWHGLCRHPAGWQILLIDEPDPADTLRYDAIARVLRDLAGHVTPMRKRPRDPLRFLAPIESIA